MVALPVYRGHAFYVRYAVVLECELCFLYHVCYARSCLLLYVLQDHVCLLQGCEEKLSDWLQENVLTVIVIAVALILIQVIKPESVCKQKDCTTFPPPALSSTVIFGAAISAEASRGH